MTVTHQRPEIGERYTSGDASTEPKKANVNSYPYSQLRGLKQPTLSFTLSITSTVTLYNFPPFRYLLLIFILPGAINILCTIGYNESTGNLWLCMRRVPTTTRSSTGGIAYVLAIFSSSLAFFIHSCHAGIFFASAQTLAFDKARRASGLKNTVTRLTVKYTVL